MKTTAAPTRINLRRSANLLEMYFGEQQLLSIAGGELRKYCACSKCRAKGVVGSLLINDSQTISGLNLMGSTGVQITFADGHDRGIFPWEYLRAISEGRALEFLDA